MSLLRVGVVIAALVLIALAVVHLRAEQTRCAARIVKLDSRWVELRRQRWTLQTRAVRLQAPQRIHDRLENLQSELIGPEVEMAFPPPARLVSDRP